MKLYENIKYLRLSHNWSQEDLALRLGYKDRTIISKIESGNVDLSLSKVLSFANIFGVDPVDLLGLDDMAINPDLSPSEQILISRYRQLNEEGQMKVSDYVEDLVRSGRYIKADPPEVVDEA